MIVTHNTFVSYSLARGTVQLQLILFIMSLYTLFSFPLLDVKQEDLKGLKIECFIAYTILITALVAITLIINVLIDYLGFESLEYPASIMGLCSEFTLLSLVIKCSFSLSPTSFAAFAYKILFLVLEFSLIGQIASGVIFMMIRGCFRSKV